MNLSVRLWMLAVVVGLFAMNAVRADIALVGGTVIDGTGKAPLHDAVVLIRGKRIEAVGTRNRVKVAPDEVQIIDVTGKYVIPGLMDANVHLISGLGPEHLIRFEGRYESVILEAAQVALKAGLTTVFDSYGPRRALTTVRDRIERGEQVGSRIFLAGTIIGIDSPVSGDFMHGSGGVLSEAFRARMDQQFTEGMGSELGWKTAGDVRLAVRAYLKNDIDFLKFLGSGHRDSKVIVFSPAAQRAMVEEAHAAGKTAQSHTTTVESLRLAMEAGVDLLQHCESTGPVPIPPELLQALAKSQIACSTLAYTERRIRDWHIAKFPDAPWTLKTKVKAQNIRAMVRVGANILLSTDAGLRHPDDNSNASYTQNGFYGGPDDPLLMPEAHFNWLVASEEMGMKPNDILQSATIRIAKAYRVDKELGTLEVGKIADLLVLNKNPLESAANYRSIETVMKAGRLVDLDSLPNPKILTAPDAPLIEPSIELSKVHSWQ
jgi:imidazolonepropionase-like amidohydrolase